MVVLYQNSYINVLFWSKSTLYKQSPVCALMRVCLCPHMSQGGIAFMLVIIRFLGYNVSEKRTPLRRKLVTGLVWGSHIRMMTIQEVDEQELCRQIL